MAQEWQIKGFGSEAEYRAWLKSQQEPTLPIVTPPVTPTPPTPTVEKPEFGAEFDVALEKIGQLGMSPEEQEARYALVEDVIGEMESRGMEMVGGRAQALGRYRSGLRIGMEEKLEERMGRERTRQANIIVAQSADIARQQIQTAANVALSITGMKYEDIQADADRDLRQWAAEMGYETQLAQLEAAADAAGLDLWDFIISGAKVGGAFGGVEGAIIGGGIGMLTGIINEIFGT